MEQILFHGHAWSPSHITGFFYPCGEGESLYRSSLGAGVNLVKGVETVVEIMDSDSTKYEIFINQKKERAPVSEYVVKEFLYFEEERCFKIIVKHKIEIPVGAGFGTSGAGALSLSLALKKALNLEIKDLECYKIAHNAEVKNKTGLGTVIGEIAGGVEMRVKCGGPGIGEVENIFFDKREKVIILFLGEYSTKQALSDSSLLEKIEKYGKESLEELMNSPSVENFMELSRWFVYKTEVANKKIMNIIDSMERKGIICSMPLFGESVFCIDHRIDYVVDNLKDYGEVIVSDISSKGAEVKKR